MAEMLISARFDEKDLKLLEACKATEKLTASDILRRAVRHYAKHLGVDAEPASTPKRKKKK